MNKLFLTLTFLFLSLLLFPQAGSEKDPLEEALINSYKVSSLKAITPVYLPMGTRLLDESEFTYWILQQEVKKGTMLYETKRNKIFLSEDNGDFILNGNVITKGFGSADLWIKAYKWGDHSRAGYLKNVLDSSNIEFYNRGSDIDNLNALLSNYSKMIWRLKDGVTYKLGNEFNLSDGLVIIASPKSKIIAGHLIFKNTYISVSSRSHLFEDTMTFTGNVKIPSVYPETFGAGEDTTTLSSRAFMTAIDLAEISNSKKLELFPNRNYLVDTGQIVYDGFYLEGNFAKVFFERKKENATNKFMSFYSKDPIVESSAQPLTIPAVKGAQLIYVDDASDFVPGDFVGIQSDTILELGSKYPLGEISQVMSVGHYTNHQDYIRIMDPISYKYDVNENHNSKVSKLNLPKVIIRNIHIEQKPARWFYSGPVYLNLEAFRVRWSAFSTFENITIVNFLYIGLAHDNGYKNTISNVRSLGLSSTGYGYPINSNGGSHNLISDCYLDGKHGISTGGTGGFLEVDLHVSDCIIEGSHDDAAIVSTHGSLMSSTYDGCTFRTGFLSTWWEKYTKWDSTKAYSKGEIVIRGNNLFKCSATLTIVDPLSTFNNDVWYVMYNYGGRSGIGHIGGELTIKNSVIENTYYAISVGSRARELTLENVTIKNSQFGISVNSDTNSLRVIEINNLKYLNDYPTYYGGYAFYLFNTPKDRFTINGVELRNTNLLQIHPYYNDGVRDSLKMHRYYEGEPYQYFIRRADTLLSFGNVTTNWDKLGDVYNNENFLIYNISRHNKNLTINISSLKSDRMWGIMRNIYDTEITLNIDNININSYADKLFFDYGKSLNVRLNNGEIKGMKNYEVDNILVRSVYNPVTKFHLNNVELNHIDKIAFANNTINDFIAFNSPLHGANEDGLIYGTSEISANLHLNGMLEINTELDNEMASGMKVKFINGDNMKFGKIVYKEFNTGKVFLADCQGDISSSNLFVCLDYSTVGEMGTFMPWGFVRNDHWNLNKPGIVYLRNGGNISLDPPTETGSFIVPLGTIMSTNTIRFQPSVDKNKIIKTYTIKRN